MTTSKINLSIAISSSALLDTRSCNDVYQKQGVEAYVDHQIAMEQKILPQGPAFKLVQKLLKLNEHPDINCTIMLISRNSADTGLRILNTIEHYQLDITRATFTNGASPYPYLKAFNAKLFLSANEDDVREALQNHCPAARIFDGPVKQQQPEQLRIAFDGDAVLFSDESEKIYQQHGFSAFAENERNNANTALQSGPFKPFLDVICELQRVMKNDQSSLIRTALVTARSAPAHERVILTLRHWGVRLDEALFLGGLDKGSFLEAFGADIFFDDQTNHCHSAAQHVATGHVPNGVMNTSKV